MGSQCHNQSCASILWYLKRWGFINTRKIIKGYVSRWYLEYLQWKYVMPVGSDVLWVKDGNIQQMSNTIRYWRNNGVGSHPMLDVYRLIPRWLGYKSNLWNVQQYTYKPHKGCLYRVHQYFVMKYMISIDSYLLYNVCHINTWVELKHTTTFELLFLKIRHTLDIIEGEMASHHNGVMWIVWYPVG